MIAAAIGMELNKLFNPLAEIVPGSVSNALNLFRVGKKSIFADFRSQQGNVRIFENPRKFDPVYLKSMNYNI
ncbi:hypothetical protein [Dolichospermum flos-aquae]|uniref:hypothetical protein n=1 Tax=Dolichospermum flosaquae TaxID=1166 RepID=UPI00187DF788|nr:hypothetical protein [Dolichospermum flos-aquae]